MKKCEEEEEEENKNSPREERNEKRGRRGGRVKVEGRQEGAGKREITLRPEDNTHKNTPSLGKK